jgi:hypothetical protein
VQSFVAEQEDAVLGDFRKVVRLDIHSEDAGHAVWVKVVPVSEKCVECRSRGRLKNLIFGEPFACPECSLQTLPNTIGIAEVANRLMPLLDERFEGFTEFSSSAVIRS